jgi:hypothetical protein
MQETYDWLIGVINSCFHDFHLECIDRLIDLFYDKYRNEGLRDELTFKRQERWAAIHGVII